MSKHPCLAVFALIGLLPACNSRTLESEIQTTSGEGSSGQEMTTAVAPDTTGPALPAESSSSSSSGSSGSDTTTGASSSSSGGAMESADGATSATESDSDTLAECGCERTEVVGYREPVEGRTPAEALAAVSPMVHSIEWYSIEGDPPPSATTTEATTTLTYAGGPIVSGPGGDNGCLFLPRPCPPGLEIPVDAHLVTADGRMDTVFSGRLTIPTSEEAQWQENLFLADPIAMEEVGGTLTDLVVIGPEGSPISLTALHFQAMNGADAFDNRFVLQGFPRLGDGILLALHEMPE